MNLREVYHFGRIRTSENIIITLGMVEICYTISNNVSGELRTCPTLILGAMDEDSWCTLAETVNGLFKTEVITLA
jgi:hypothetical protein